MARTILNPQASSPAGSFTTNLTTVASLGTDASVIEFGPMINMVQAERIAIIGNATMSFLAGASSASVSMTAQPGYEAFSTGSDRYSLASNSGAGPISFVTTANALGNGFVSTATGYQQNSRGAEPIGPYAQAYVSLVAEQTATVSLTLNAAVMWR